MSLTPLLLKESKHQYVLFVFQFSNCVFVCVVLCCIFVLFLGGGLLKELMIIKSIGICICMDPFEFQNDWAGYLSFMLLQHWLLQDFIREESIKKYITHAIPSCMTHNAMKGLFHWSKQQWIFIPPPFRSIRSILLPICCYRKQDPTDVHLLRDLGCYWLISVIQHCLLWSVWAQLIPAQCV